MKFHVFKKGQFRSEFLGHLELKLANFRKVIKHTIYHLKDNQRSSHRIGVQQL